MPTLVVGGLVALSSACADEPMAPDPRTSPFVRIVGTAQDGGLPHAACRCVRCAAARSDPARRRSIASLAIVIPGRRDVFLIDATPDIREQIDALEDVRDAPADRVDRAPLSGMLLTHAHIGHYAGLIFLGFEAVHARDLPIYCTPRMAGFLRENGPWSQLVELGNLDLVESPPGQPFELGEEITVTPLAVPHRDEFADTVGFRIRGPHRTVLYVPDTDGWQHWEPSLEQRLEGVDVAILDGSFYSLAELPGRDVGAIGHPLIVDSIDRLAERVETGQLQVLFTHLNHSNPALDPDSNERTEIDRRGFGVAEEGQEIDL